MVAIFATQFAPLSAVVARNARHSRRSVSRAVRACAETPKTEAPKLSESIKEADAEWSERAAAPVEAQPAATFSAAIDPADGTIAEGAPLGDDMTLLNSAMGAFKDARSVEVINGRTAMIGWMAALYYEFSTNTSLWHQVFNTRTFTLADGVTKTSTYPAVGLFLVPVTVLVVLGASLAPSLKGEEVNGLDKEPKDFAMFRAEAEMTNGRGAMVGLLALLFVEKFTNGAALF